ncbi:hypothetical protein A2276_04425 [candidate division WOR-1 bacterium RIFOXYA12_FULL_43_27]|uniref:Uncharacterized protein n=1 Tax=candidate division WOR-1 bacterium RIFOXYC2_FULL_46_14 TaxID=1802587 RepID=A0A1F4U3X7_UNCSA|nr:MAG: hypothetical protein A2276_04425 [candidate division WOR-1 bacterium RIFOXYA12_FULL_43_27]OGC18925.1 MAG: hypothetical protein A2292_08410 [candidate division WOR-1 bacterium RIFOXYB2_FULL_46_45]OGC29066.1 MAG: hypothetical protein A2232_03475 [candidate division WOR-1 bacterium RIFOXYA2_FULL_46_56]OGC39685.1 MAG: hypothetical protein A2438_06865 [candidate division WOR-1 bacterium RIFOXYC2_FULL_46_14]
MRRYRAGCDWSAACLAGRQAIAARRFIPPKAGFILIGEIFRAVFKNFIGLVWIIYYYLYIFF